MSKYEAPRSDAERLTVIKKSIETGQADRLAGLNYLEVDLLTQLGIFAPKFASALDATGSFFTSRAKLDFIHRKVVIQRNTMLLRSVSIVWARVFHCPPV